MENYRGFEKYDLRDLQRVNLLVGRNNSGKTSVLEAVHLTYGADPRTLIEIAENRGELSSVDKEEENSLRLQHAFPPRRVPLDIHHFFHAHRIMQDSYISIRSDSPKATFQIRTLDPENMQAQPQLFPDLVSSNLLGLEISTAQYQSTFILLEHGNDARVRDSSRGRDFVKEKLPPKLEGQSRFITQGSLDISIMAELWDAVVSDGAEQDIIAALQIIEPSTNSLYFTATPNRQGHPNGGILVGLKGDKRRFPLGSHGEGMRRLLGLALALANTRGGTLLIDEIDTGLHYSVMEDMWHMVVETARRLDIQVFATTHSLDCIRGLAGLCSRQPELVGEVSLQTIDRALDHAISYTGEQIQIAAEQEMEVR